MRSKSEEPYIQKRLLNEMVARVIKDYVRRKMRFRMRKVKVLSEEPFNQVFGILCMNLPVQGDSQVFLIRL